MLRRQALTFGSLLLGAVTLGGWKLFKQKDHGPLLLSARDDSDGKHYAVGYRLDGTRVFATESCVGCHYSSGIAIGFKRNEFGMEILDHDNRPQAIIGEAIGRTDEEFLGKGTARQLSELKRRVIRSGRGRT
jgi:hypothetical protein